MPVSENYTGCRAIIYNEENHSTIAETSILEYDEDAHIISLMHPAFQKTMPTRLSVLIFCQGALYEYKGTPRKSGLPSLSIEIALYKGAEKEDRTAIRYDVDAPGLIENMVIAGRLMRLSEPIRVLVRNISSTGCFVRSSAGCINLNASFQLQMDLGGTPVVLYATVVRIKTLNHETVEYGCKFRPGP